MVGFRPQLVVVLGLSVEIPFDGGISAITELFHKSFLSQWNLDYQGAFSRTFLFHDGISAIKEPFTR
jgi:hypothetical protein